MTKKNRTKRFMDEAYDAHAELMDHTPYYALVRVNFTYDDGVGSPANIHMEVFFYPGGRIASGCTEAHARDWVKAHNRAVYRERIVPRDMDLNLREAPHPSVSPTFVVHRFYGNHAFYAWTRAAADALHDAFMHAADHDSIPPKYLLRGGTK